MKRIGLFLTGAAILAVIVWCHLFVPKPADASIFGRSRTQASDLLNFTSAIVCSTFVNDPNTNVTLPYAQVCPPAGYVFSRVDVCNASAGAAQTATIRFWQSASDSTSINASAVTIYLASGGAEVHSFPIRCAKVSLDAIADTDDIYVIGYVAE
jgi:hypothetical protein